MDQRASAPLTWTPELVCTRMVEAFREHPLGLDERARAAEVLTWPALHLLALPDERDALLWWAKWKARGLSIREQCKARGWSRVTFMRRKNRACEVIAGELNGSGSRHARP
ncbi:hypothetical protein [Salinarimonas soli]|uniref:Uncharacterized protein n=1 Tax=Salinarimonas soli TaxID=1638099 RepID=A0A5B2VGL3_9HYPH|nr:hypothetical protein [Salinarimonas soli]KAA2237696.1 hypothetical protein F0L46_08430 [Salinarimonas soli]